MPGTPFKDGPAAMATSAADLYTPGANTYALVRHIHLANGAGSAATVSLYLGLTGGSANGTELCELLAIAASDVADLYFPSGLKVTTTDFISGLASATTVVATITGELYVA